MSNEEISKQAYQFLKVQDIEPNEKGKYIFKSGASSINLPLWMADFAEQMIDEHEEAMQSTHSKDIGELLEALIKNNHTLNALKCFSESKNHTEGHYAALRMIVDNEFLIQKHSSK